MSTKWNFVGSNSLESWDVEKSLSDEKEKARRRWQKRHKLFKNTMKIDKMEIMKPKKHYKDEESDVDTD